MSTRILVTGGTGTLGSLVVPRLRDAGCTVRVLSRQPREPVWGVEAVVGNLDTGEGVAAAVDGVDVVVNCAGAAAGDDVKAASLVRAAAPAGVRHVVHISVVGADRMPVVGRADRATFGYFASKLAAERVIEQAGIPWTTLRATQFHELILTVAQSLTKLPVVPLPARSRVQPVAAAEVAGRLVELAQSEPAGLAPSFGGPRVYTAKQLLRSYLRASGRHRLSVPVWLPGKGARAFRAGANLAPDHAAGRQTWEEFLAEWVANGRNAGERTRTSTAGATGS
jgi:uncharacterized protein YbjT (DUF2867 family)